MYSGSIRYEMKLNASQCLFADHIPYSPLEVRYKQTITMARLFWELSAVENALSMANDSCLSFGI